MTKNDNKKKLISIQLFQNFNITSYTMKFIKVHHEIYDMNILNRHEFA